MELLRFNKSQKYMIFDFETCSLNLGSLENKPWQLAFLIIENDKIKESCNYWIKWDKLNMSKEAAQITGWTKRKYEKNAVDPKAPLEHFEKYLYDDDYIKLAHNGLGFDIYIHSIYRQLMGMKPDYSYLNRVIDTNCLAKSVKCEIDYDKNIDLLAWQYKLCHHIKRGVRTSLKQCCKDYDIPFDPKKLHDAMYDIQKNYEVFKKLIWDVEI
jgi:DNA polymerase III epsilon subunit-like protein